MTELFLGEFKIKENFDIHLNSNVGFMKCKSLANSDLVLFDNTVELLKGQLVKLFFNKTHKYFSLSFNDDIKEEFTSVHYYL